MISTHQLRHPGLTSRQQLPHSHRDPTTLLTRLIRRIQPPHNIIQPSIIQPTINTHLTTVSHRIARHTPIHTPRTLNAGTVNPRHRTTQPGPHLLNNPPHRGHRPTHTRRNRPHRNHTHHRRTHRSHRSRIRRRMRHITHHTRRGRRMPHGLKRLLQPLHNLVGRPHRRLLRLTRLLPHRSIISLRPMLISVLRPIPRPPTTITIIPRIPRLTRMTTIFMTTISRSHLTRPRHLMSRHRPRHTRRI